MKVQKAKLYLWEDSCAWCYEERVEKPQAPGLNDYKFLKSHYKIYYKSCIKFKLIDPIILPLKICLRKSNHVIE
jgi:hypothetical protein